jgi:hypothetical protein
MKRHFFATAANVALAAALLASCGGGGGDSDKLDLKLRLQQGQSYGTKMVAEQTITQTIQGQTMDVKQTIGMAYTYAVTKVESDGSALVDVSYDWVRYAQDGPMGTMEYDSSNPPANTPEEALVYAALLGRRFSMTMTPLGEVAEVRGIDEMLSHILLWLNVPEGSERDALLEGLESQFGEQAMRESFEKASTIYPGKPVTVGDLWSKKVALATGMPMILDNTWTLQSRKDGVAFIDVKTKVSPNPDAKPLEYGGMTVTYDLSGEQSGTLEVDEASGWVLRSSIKQNISGQISAMGMTWPLTIVSDIRFEPWKK